MIKHSFFPPYWSVAEVKETSILPMLTVDMENKENGSLDVKK